MERTSVFTLEELKLTLGKISFDPWKRRKEPRLEYGVFHFNCNFDSEMNERSLQSWRVVDATFTDALNRKWNLLDEFVVKRPVSYFSDGVELSFDFYELEEDADLLIERSKLVLVLESGAKRVGYSFEIFHSGLGGSDGLANRLTVSILDSGNRNLSANC